MVSRKKAAGKARKAAKAKAEEEAQQQAPGADAQTQQLVRSNSNIRIRTKCAHGPNDLPSLQGSCSELVSSSFKEFDYAAKDDDLDIAPD